MGTLKMMLVDDEERYLETTQKILTKMGYFVETASGGHEALKKLHSNEIQVVVLDVKMPVMDGHETFRKIKKQFPLTEVIMLTGHGTVGSAIETLKEGAFDYLMKPADISQLVDKVEEAYKQYTKHQEKITMAMFEKSHMSPRDILSRNASAANTKVKKNFTEPTQ